MEFISTNWEWMAGTLALVILLAERIARITPSKTDDKILASVRKIARVVGLDVPNNPGKDGT